MPSGEVWLQGEVPLNPGLVAIIGNKGSGKSALSDSIGLLGSCSTSDAFSFLDKDRFCNPKTGRAQHVEAALHWYDGEPHTRRLDEDVREDEPKRVKYLPQNFVERICNELSTSGGGAFEAELKKVVFSKVADADRLGKRSLDELVQFRTQELRKEADSLAFGLAELGIARAALEERLDPAIRSGLQKRIERVKEEIRSHEAAKPVEKEPPPDDPGATPKSKDDLEALNESKSERENVGSEISRNERIVVAEQLRAATANKLLDKLENLQAEFDRRLGDMSTEADALGLDVTTLATLTIDRPAVTRLRDGAIARRDVARKAVDGPTPEGLKAKLVQLDEQIKSLQDRLSRPNREYQAYLEEKSKWEATLSKLTGTGEDPNSSRGLEAELAALDDVPTEIAKIQDEQEKTAEKIHELRVAEACVYTELYGPVQKFISEHPLAKEQLKLEFTVELVQEGFVDNLLSHLNQNKIGSFYGIEDGRTKAEAVAALEYYVKLLNNYAPSGVQNWNWPDLADALSVGINASLRYTLDDCSHG
ncbi:MAG: hypothetical protein IID41_03825 [Planctomycetes bacterium]|nr:hypothetical protein [Planctomycetota bacterium]